MRTLVFNVKNQIIEKNRSCDFSGLVAGTKGYLEAEFLLSNAWEGCAVVVGFFSKDGKEFPPQILSKNNSCIIPDEVLQHHEFSIKLYGKKGSYEITTRPITIKQYGGI